MVVAGMKLRFLAGPLAGAGLGGLVLEMNATEMKARLILVAQGHAAVEFGPHFCDDSGQKREPARVTGSQFSTR